MSAYYNEHDPHAAQWLRNLIARGAIAPGVVDERDIRDVVPSELSGFNQVHCFAGIGVWSYALRLAGWPDDKPVWTGSCPCQPFSAAGKGGGFDDERHLWPAWHWLIHQCRPETIFGEQVASKDGLAWLDLVCADLEGTDYTGWVGDLCAPLVGAPQIRQRLFFVASSRGVGHEGLFRRGDSEISGWRQGWRPQHGPERCEPLSGVAGSEGERLQRRPDDGDEGRRQRASGQGCETGELGDASGERLALGSIAIERRGTLWNERAAVAAPSTESRPGPTNGFWRDADWIGCTDGKWRPVIASHVKVAYGLAADLGRMCSDEGADEKGEVSGGPDKIGSHAGTFLHSLRGPNGTQEVSGREDGIPNAISSQTVLRSGLHGESDGEGNLRLIESLKNEGARKGQDGVRNMWSDGEPSCSSHRREPAQQRPIQLDDVVPLLSPSSALAELHGDWRTSRELQALSKSICEGRPMLHTPDATQAVWASLSQEEKDWIILGFDASRWAHVVSFPLIGREAFSAGGPFEGKSRAKMLKGYGNAIVAPLAAELIRAHIDATSV